MSGTVQANDGAMLPIDSLPVAIAYNGDLVATMTVVFGPNTYVQTFSYTGDLVTNISRWVKQ